MIKYKSLKQNIPHRVKANGVEYEVLYVDDFKDGATLGETRFHPPQLVIKNNIGAKETVLTAYHEWLHILSEEYDINLTETQVTKMEKTFGDMKKFITTLEGK
jgi:hypothetical protein